MPQRRRVLRPRRLLRPGRLPPGVLLPRPDGVTRTVLFVCVENAARSLIAEAVFNAAAPPGWRAVSAGTEPARAANPRTGPMLAEIGLLLPDHPPQLLTPAAITGASRRFTMGCLDRASCPTRLKETELEDWDLPDPARLDDAGFRRVRDEIRQRVHRLVRTLSPERVDG